MDLFVSLALRVLVPVILAVSLWLWGYNSGVSRESDRRDAHELDIREKADEEYETAANAARTHAIASIEWKRRADSYYRKWQERLNHVNDDQLSECATATNEEKPGAGMCMLSPDWVWLYNDAWYPDGMPADSAGTDAVPRGAVAATPRDALVNIRTNAELCADDRQRQRKLIDYLHELEAGRARPTD
ncbi:hypothetical protein [Nitrosovibrio sp. Nv6]|uniref:hypothetical protein n=1 Tax=Nitrosovibrio sp. Nv6 TaxID=1855340 RepID=UPI0008D5F5DC|nr:hypothetical protein [Nitrosovibrio sp. Nv6]SEO64184.1 hypothetical protein SAMN05216316_0688 [Nitrosovibrio sp. Nv6]